MQTRRYARSKEPGNIKVVHAIFLSTPHKTKQMIQAAEKPDCGPCHQRTMSGEGDGWVGFQRNQHGRPFKGDYVYLNVI